MEPVDNRTLLVDPVYGATRPKAGTPESRLALHIKPRLVYGDIPILESTECVCVPREVWENCLVEW